VTCDQHYSEGFRGFHRKLLEGRIHELALFHRLVLLLARRPHRPTPPLLALNLPAPRLPALLHALLILHRLGLRMGNPQLRLLHRNKHISCSHLLCKPRKVSTT